jgi:hypothetical protein
MVAIELERTSAHPHGSARVSADRAVSTNGAATPFGNDPVEHWEIHSELVLVSPEVRSHALEVLARERALLLLRYQAVDGQHQQASAPAPFLLALGLYLARTVALTLVLALIAAGGTVAVALALELMHR